MINKKPCVGLLTFIFLTIATTFCFAEPISYGSNSTSTIEKYNNTTENKKESDSTVEQDSPNNEDLPDTLSDDSSKKDSQDINNDKPYSKTSIIEKVPVYKNGEILKNIYLKKIVKANTITNNGVKGKDVTIYTQYVKYWETTSTTKTPVIGSKTEHKFIAEDDKNKVDLNSL